METVDDRFLGGKLILKQPRHGYRAAMDPVLLAAAVPACNKGHVLDLGCGIGTALLCYGARVPGARLTGIEMDPTAADLARENAVANGMADRVTILTGDLLALPDGATDNAYDQVFANPPYMHATAGEVSPIADRARSNVEGSARLKDWVRVMLRLTRPKGGLAIIHRADRLDEIVNLLHRKAGDITIIPLWPRTGEPAKRVIIRARKDVKGGTRMHPGLTLHGPADDPEGRYTAQTIAILRDGGALNLCESPGPNRSQSPGTTQG